jgi:5-methyltetrahydrofolate--homocysteine methyltransferase
VSIPTKSLRRALAGGTLIGDGGLGSSLLGLELDPLRDFAGQAGCCEMLNVERPDLVGGLHGEFFAAGCDTATTNSFCGDAPTLARRGLAGRAHELALAAAQIARAAAAAAARDGRPRYVLGSLGPGFDLPTFSGASCTDLEAGYRALAAALLEGEVDGLVIETCRDAAQAQAALRGARAALGAAGSDAVLCVSFAPFSDGTLAGGVPLGTALDALRDFEPDLLAVNCVTGAREMEGPLAALRGSGVIGLGAWPNAGLPSTFEGRKTWPIEPREFARELSDLAQRFDLRLVGGCCGTSPAHLRALVERLRPDG